MSDNKNDIKAFKKALYAGPTKFSFTKKDGTLRYAEGTLNQKYLPDAPKTEDTEDKPKRAPKTLPEGTVFYYDLEKKGYRSFNESQLVSWEI